MTEALEKQAIGKFLRGFMRAKTKPTYRMLRAARHADVPKALIKEHGHRKARTIWNGMRRQSDKNGVDSVIGFLAEQAARPFKKDKALRRTFTNKVNAPALKADIAVGDILAKTPIVGKRLFRIKEKLPMGEKGLYREIERSSALGPLTKMRDVAAPIAIGVGLDKGIRKATEIATAKKDQDHMVDRDLLAKSASTMLRLDSEVKEHTKRAHALKLLYKQAEMGVAPLPQTFGELEEKLASLLNQDLTVLEKALEFTSGEMKLGELARSDLSTPQNAQEQFQAAVIGDIDF